MCLVSLWSSGCSVSAGKDIAARASLALSIRMSSTNAQRSRVVMVVCCSEHLDACGARAGTPSAEAGEQVDCCGHVFLAGVA